MVCLAVAGIMSCAKEEQATVGADALSDSIKVFYGQRHEGMFPSPAANAPVLADTANVAVMGRYVVVLPMVVSGKAAGYYVRIDGANSYFKVDYTQPRGARKSNVLAKTAETGMPNAGDSAIVLQLPEGFDTTFCISYAAYDSAGHTSGPVQLCVTDLQPGTGSALTGTWRKTADSSAAGWKEDFYSPDSTFRLFYCDNDTLRGYCPEGQTCPTDSIMTEASLVTKLDLTLGSGGAAVFEFARNYSTAVLPQFCSGQVTYNAGSQQVQTHYLWAFVSTGKLILIREQTPAGGPEINVYHVRLNGNSLTLSQSGGITQYTKN